MIIILLFKEMKHKIKNFYNFLKLNLKNKKLITKLKIKFILIWNFYLIVLFVKSNLIEKDIQKILAISVFIYHLISREFFDPSIFKEKFLLNKQFFVFEIFCISLIKIRSIIQKC